MRNFRDLSYLGLKKGHYLRADVLYRLTREEKRMLKEDHNLGLIIDLRRPEEAAALKDSRIPGVKYRNIPMLQDGDDGRSMVTIKNLELPDMKRFYRESVLPRRKDTWMAIFKLLVESECGILIHCSGGKDRTGVVTAITLYALGFDKKTIYDDYLLTNQNPLYYKQVAEKMDEESKAIFLDYFSAKEEYLDESFGEIKRSFGSVDNFLREMCGLDEEKIHILREKLLP